MSSIFGIDLDNIDKAEDFSQTETSANLQAEQTCSQESDDCKKRKAEKIISSLISDYDIIEKKARLSTSALNLDDLSNIPRIKIFNIKTDPKCTHHVAVPPDFDYKPLQINSKEPAKTFSFELDPFQQQASLCIDNNQSVMISAHTSAGKTVVAEYAIASCLAANQRVIYTTPIKALSNQKFREFSEQFPEVGLLTGDATINPNANILIMTTEIMQNMLYRGSQIMREVGWVIFDEIHYMRDPERGRVWEEAIVLLPSVIRMVFLSATIPNARQFAEWIAYLHKQPCHVIASTHRPVPLRHYLFPAGSDGLYLVLDEGRFMERNFAKAVASLQVAETASRSGGGPRGIPKAHNQNIVQLVKLVKHRSLEPLIIFSFSKKECEIYALKLASLDFTSDGEKRVVEEVFNNAIDCLSAEDKQLPQIKSVLPLLKKGIGIHHGGLLPIIKETVEILFSEGLIKCLFATETFAMGLNMPARTVLFTSARKFDGHSYRWLTPSEYIQMSGRAGRRGKDDSGTVIFMLADSMTPEEARELLLGQPDSLNSAFRITYNMLLNLMRVEDINPEYLMERSFCQFQNFAKLPGVYEQLKQAQQQHDEVLIDRLDLVQSYHELQQCLTELLDTKWKYIHKPQYIVPFLQPGRLVHIKTEERDFGWGIVINLVKRTRNDRSTAITPESFYVLECLLWVPQDAHRKTPAQATSHKPQKDDQIITIEDDDEDMVIVSDEEASTMAKPTEPVAEILPMRCNCISEISAVRVLVPKDLRSLEARISCIKTIDRVKEKMQGPLPQLDPIKDMQITEPKFQECQEKISIFQDRLARHELHSHPERDALIARFESKEKLKDQMDKLQSELKSRVSLIQNSDLQAKKRILRRLGYCSDLDVIALKGRVACELTSADELLLSECLFDGLFNKLSPENCAALLSCFVCEEKSTTGGANELDKELAGAFRTLQDTARRIARISNECRLKLDIEDYVDSLKPAMMMLVHQWACGVPFYKLCENTSIFEGSIVRGFRLLEELLRQMSNAAHVIDNAALEEKFNRASALIKRDIVFAASLYL